MERGVQAGDAVLRAARQHGFSQEAAPVRLDSPVPPKQPAPTHTPRLISLGLLMPSKQFNTKTGSALHLNKFQKLKKHAISKDHIINHKQQVHG